MTPVNPSRPSKWRRRLIISLLAFIAAIFVIRIVVALLLPLVIDRVARIYDLDCTYDRLDLSVLGGSAQIWNVRLTPLEGGDPVLRADYGQGDISLLNLLTGRLVIFRIAADGVDLNIQRTSDGRLPLLARFAIPATTSAPQDDSMPMTIDLQPPLRIDALRLQHVRARFDDQFVIPNLETSFALDMRLSDVGVVGKPTQFELNISSDPMLDSLQIIGQGQSDGKTLSAQMTLLMRGLHLKPAAAYLSGVGLKPTADDISAYMSGALNLSVASDPLDGLQAQLNLDKAHITCDGEEAVAMDHLSLDAQSLTAGAARLGQLAISGVRCNGRRGADGGLSALGVEYAPLSQSASSKPAISAGFPAIRLRLGRFTLDDLHTAFLDEGITPSVALAFDIQHLSADNPIPDPDYPDSPVVFSAQAGAPGMVRAITVSGHARPFAADKSFQLKTAADGIVLSAIQPYLSLVGLTTEWKDGSLRLAVNGSLFKAPDGRWTGSAALADFHLTDPDELLTLSQAKVDAASFDPRTATIHAGTIDIAGPALAVHRDANGDLHALGFRLNPHKGTSTANSTSLIAMLGKLAVQGRTGPVAFLPNFDIQHFNWHGIQLALRDDAIQPPTELNVSDAGVSVENFIFPAPSGESSSRQGALHAWLSAPGLAQALRLDGTITAAPQSLAVESDLRGDGLRTLPLASYLKEWGIQPTLENGSLRLHSNAQISMATGIPTLSLQAGDGLLTDGDQELFSLASLRMNELRLEPDQISVDALQVASPKIRVARRADGSLEIAGVLLPPPGQFAASASSISIPPVAANSVQISDAGLHWIDHAVVPMVDVTANCTADVNDFKLGPSTRPASVHFAANVTGSLDSLTADGTMSVSADQQTADLKVSAEGIRAGAAAAYLPRDVVVSLKNGGLHASITTAAAVNPLGGRAMEVTVTDLDLRDGDAADSLLQFTSLHAKASRIDPAAKLIAMDDLTVQGLETGIHISSKGLDLPGLELTPAANSSDPASAPTSAAAVSNDDLLKQVAAQRDRLPLIQLANLDVNCRGIAVAFEAPDHPAPVILTDLRVRSTSPLTWLGRDVESNPPTDLELTGRLDAAKDGSAPIADSFKLDAQAAPFLRQKTLSLDFVVSGIHGAGLAEVTPSLLSGIEPDALQDGQASGNLTLSLRLQNVRQTEFSFAYGGKLDFSLKDIALRGQSGGPVLAGVQEIHSEGISIGPNFAGVEFPEVSIENISGQASLESDGIHALGIVIPLPTDAQKQLIGGPTTTPSTTATAAAFTVDRLLMSGMNFRMEDRTVDPPLVVPIDGLDVEALGLSSLSLTNDKPIRFSALIDSGKIPLPGGKAGASERQLFSQITSNGIVSLSPNLKGWAKASVSGFELAGLTSLAKSYSISLTGGTFDGDTDLRFPGDGSVDTSSRLVLTDLDVSDSPNGEISHALNLPAPLDVAIGAVQDQDGSITIPLNIPIRNGELDKRDVLGAASVALAGVVTTAIASTPLKVANLIGLNSPQVRREPPITITFPPGYPLLGPEEIARLAPLIKRLQRDPGLEVTIRHDLGSNDIALAAQRVNPSTDDADDLADSFNRRREALLAARRTAAGDVRALLASTATREAAQAVERLRTIDQQLADLDNALDKIYDLLRPGADRQATRRTRQAALSIAAARLDAVRDLLEGSGKLKIEPQRIHLSNAQFTAAPESAAGRLTIVVVETK